MKLPSPIRVRMASRTACRNSDVSAVASAASRDRFQTTLDWLTALNARLETTDEKQPVVLIAASGGGSRAALFSALIYEALSRFSGEAAVDPPLAQAFGTLDTDADGRLTPEEYAVYAQGQS